MSTVVPYSKFLPRRLQADRRQPPRPLLVIISDKDGRALDWAWEEFPTDKDPGLATA